jgi:hypothetical protein
MQSLWRPDKNHFALIDDAILTEFAQKIDPWNRIPSMHSAVTSSHQPCLRMAGPKDLPMKQILI